MAVFVGISIRPAEPRTKHQRSGCQADTEPGCLCGRSLDQCFKGFGDDVWGEQEKADRHPFLGAALSISRSCPVSGEAPKDNDARKTLDGTVEAKGDKSYRP